METVGLSSLKAEKVPALKLQISELKTSNKKNTSDSSFQKNQPTRSNSNSNFEKKNKEPRSHRYRSQNKINFKENKKIKLLNGKYPTKLVGREINTTRENKTNGFFEKKNEKKSFLMRISDKKSEKEESSSLSTYNPTDDMQKIFRHDFGKIINENSIPKILQPIEIKPPKHRGHNFSSISAQVFCSSSEISD